MTEMNELKWIRTVGQQEVLRMALDCLNNIDTKTQYRLTYCKIENGQMIIDLKDVNKGTREIASVTDSDISCQLGDLSKDDSRALSLDFIAKMYAKLKDKGVGEEYYNETYRGFVQEQIDAKEEYFMGLADSKKKFDADINKISNAFNKRNEKLLLNRDQRVREANAMLEGIDEIYYGKDETANTSFETVKAKVSGKSCAMDDTCGRRNPDLMTSSKADIVSDKKASFADYSDIQKADIDENAIRTSRIPHPDIKLPKSLEKLSSNDFDVDMDKPN